MKNHKSFIILKNISTSGFCAWDTNDPFDVDSGISGAGYSSKEEALSDTLQGTPSSSLIIVDLCDMGDDALHEFDDQGDRLYDLLQNKVPSGYESTLRDLYQQHKKRLTQKDLLSNEHPHYRAMIGSTKFD